MKNLVYITIRGNDKQLCEVPAEVILKAGKVVYIQRRNQSQPTQVTCLTDSFELSDYSAEIILNELLGYNYPPLAKVVGVGLPSYIMMKF